MFNCHPRRWGQNIYNTREVEVVLEFSVLQDYTLEFLLGWRNKFQVTERINSDARENQEAPSGSDWEGNGEDIPKSLMISIQMEGTKLATFMYLWHTHNT